MVMVKTKEGFPTTPVARIYLGNNRWSLVDPEKFEELICYHWFAHKSFNCWYAVRTAISDGKRVFIRMHREIANTPWFMVCHHINKNSLDNRLENLQNMTWWDHTKLHSHR